ncbi:MAG: ribosome silencing factor [Gammaproteobacteria bacterium]|nr:MAG: ribosome silencing factor [Gammaproteobacteria bacterium]
MEIDELKTLVIDALEDLKGEAIEYINLKDMSSFTDAMVIVSGTSTRQVKALANNVISCAKQHGITPLGVEGENYGEWVLVDLGDIVVHVMLPEIRDFYNLEKLWKLELLDKGKEAADT